MNHSAIWYFEHFGLLQGLSDQQKQTISQQSDMLHLKRGQPVYLAGDPSRFVYLVKAGAVKIVGKAPEGCEVILTIPPLNDVVVFRTRIAAAARGGMLIFKHYVDFSTHRH
jgi:CRP-like cAMP-binding protein